MILLKNNHFPPRQNLPLWDSVGGEITMTIKLTIDRFENDKAILKTEDRSTIIWPKNQLPADSHEGMVLIFNIIDDAQAEKDKKELAKDILNEILDVSNK